MNLQVASATQEGGKKSGAHTLSKSKQLYQRKHSGVHAPPHPQLSIQIQVLSTLTHTYEDSVMLISSC